MSEMDLSATVAFRAGKPPAVSDPQQCASDDIEVIHFRQFEVVPEARLLLRTGQPVTIGSRAFDLLVVLLRARGRVVGKDAIIKHVWPTTFVEESNIRFQIACLRKALGEDRDLVKTIPAQGYLFAADVPPGSGRVNPQRSRVADFDEPAAIWRAQDDAPNQRSQPRSSRIAVIDDDGDVRDGLTGLLRSAGFEVEGFASAQAFLRSGLDASLACIVVDVLLPGPSGLGLREKLLRPELGVPVIFMSEYADVHMSVRAMKAGAVDFLMKPVRHDDLLSAVQIALSPAHGARWRSRFPASNPWTSLKSTMAIPF